MKPNFKCMINIRSDFLHKPLHFFQVVKSFKKIQIMKMQMEKSITKVVVKIKRW